MELIRFTLDNRHYELSRVVVESRLYGVEPDTIRKHAVCINDTRYPPSRLSQWPWESRGRS